MNAYNVILDDLAQRIAVFMADANKPGDFGVAHAGLVPRKEAAGLLRRSASTMYRLEQKGLLTPIRISERVYYRADDVELLIGGKVKPQMSGEDSPFAESGYRPMAADTQDCVFYYEDGVCAVYSSKADAQANFLDCVRDIIEDYFDSKILSIDEAVKRIVRGFNKLLII